MNPPAGPPDTGPVPRVGDLLRGAGFVSDAALARGLARQRLENRKLGELIVELGMLERADLDAVLSIQNDLRAGRAGDLADVVRSRLGAILLASNCVSQAQLERALARLEDREEHLGAALVRQGALNPAQLNAALVFQRHLHARRSDRFKLGRMLVESGDISMQALWDAIERQTVTGNKLGETLLEAGAVAKPALAAVLDRQRRFIAAAMAAIAVLGAAGVPADAVAGSTARLQVSARILTHVSLRTMKTPDQVTITAADIARGYVDLSEPIQMDVQTNSPTGLLVGFSLNSTAFTGAVVSGAAGSWRVGSSAPTLMIAQHGQGMRTESLTLHLRLELARDAAPGVIVMPVSLLLSSA